MKTDLFKGHSLNSLYTKMKEEKITNLLEIRRT